MPIVHTLVKSFIYIYIYIFFLIEFQLMTSTFNNHTFIIRLKYQLIFSVDND